MINKQDLLKLQQKVESLAKQKEILKEAKTKFEKETEMTVKAIKELEADISQQKDVLTEQGLQEFKETESKTLSGGLKIRVKNTYKYDEDEAFEWAKKTGICLSLDRKKFEKIGFELVDFVEKITTNTVTFPKTIKLDE